MNVRCIPVVYIHALTRLLKVEKTGAWDYGRCQEFVNYAIMG